ncbi:hypothetical protein [Amycolatopsis plumensis]|uniref:Uncharacterized protein n=1 Tax=Amycolatopsis plumensis TaxID=236508 RepID=A0ABV5U7Z6_9PSEU
MAFEWAPVVTGSAAIVGAVAGNLTSAWRESKRWERETKREELRHSRETEREQKKARHDFNLHWSERKLELYESVLAKLEELSTLMSRLWRNDTLDDGSTPTAEDLKRVQREFALLQTRARLIASPVVNNSIEEYHLASRVWVQRLARINPGEPWTSKINEATSDLSAAYKKVLTTMQAEIGAAS